MYNKILGMLVVSDEEVLNAWEVVIPPEKVLIIMIIHIQL